MSDAAAVLKRIKDENIPFVDLRFTDPRGKWQHLAIDTTVVDEDTFSDGIMFDGSSIAGWKVINESDMTLMPDVSTAVMDPYSAQPSLILICDIVEPTTGQAYARDPRSLAKRAEAHVGFTGVGDATMFGPEPEFFVFDDVRFEVSMNSTFYAIDHEEGPYNSGREYEHGNVGHRPRSRAVISRCRRWTLPATSAPKWSPPWRPWACRWKSITTKWRRPNTNWAWSAHRC